MNSNDLDLQQRAADFAKKTLKSKGIEYPMPDKLFSAAQNYERIKLYAEKEAALIIQFMRMPSGPRPIVLDTTQSTKKSWERYND
jgi:hypothetical protein